jgi:hypothetical protein
MSHELFYTSAPRGLKPGSQGFCTVAATRGIPAALVEKLESLSSYRPVFAPSDPNAGLNPVVYSHLRISVAGKTYSVLSRICAAGLDYTDRTNKFAHHVVLDPAELPPGGPAWLLTQPGFMETTWNGAVGVLPAGRQVPHGDSPPRICKHWESITGDAGWAGVVAESFVEDSARPIYLIFEPGIDTLPLMDEVIALLPPARRWDVTFSTYFTNVLQGLACCVRCVLKESPEQKKASGLPGVLAIPLTDEITSAHGAVFVSCARSGKLPSSATLNPSRMVTEPNPNEASREPGLEVQASRQHSRSLPPKVRPSQDRADLSPPGSPPAPPISFQPQEHAWLPAFALGMAIAIGLLLLSENLFGLTFKFAGKENARAEMPEVAATTPQPAPEEGHVRKEVLELKANREELTKKNEQLTKKNEELLDQLKKQKSHSLEGAEPKKTVQKPAPAESRHQERPAASPKRAPAAVEAPPLELVRSYFVLPVYSRNTEAEALELDGETYDGFPDPQRNDYSLRLRGLPPKCQTYSFKSKQEESRVKVYLVSTTILDDPGKLLAEFFTKLKAVNFQWYRPEGIADSVLSEAGQYIRDAVLEIQDTKLKKRMLFGLNRRKERGKPAIFDFRHSETPKLDINRFANVTPTEGKPLHLCIPASNKEAINATTEQSTLTFEFAIDQRHHVSVVGNVKSEHKLAGKPTSPVLEVSSYAIYKEVDGLAVEVYRFEPNQP